MNYRSRAYFILASVFVRFVVRCGSLASMLKKHDLIALSQVALFILVRSNFYQ